MRPRITTNGTTRRLALAVGLFGAAGAAACGDSTAPWSDFAPERAVERLDEVVQPLAGDGDVLLGLDLAVGTLEAYGGPWLADALVVSRPPATASARAAGALAALRSGHGGGEGGVESLSAFTVPTEVVGETLEWEPGYGYYVSGRTGAPSNGVRVFLYRMSGSTGYPVEPLSRIGYVDLIDADDGSAEGVRVRAVGTLGPDRVLADYRVSLTGSGSADEGEFSVRTLGAMALAGTAELGLDLEQRLEWSRSRDRDELLLDYRYSRGSRSVTLVGRATARYDAAAWADFDFTTELLGERPTTAVEASVGSDGTVRGEILSDGRRVVRIRGHDGQPTFERADGGRLSSSETTELEWIWTGITDLIWWTDWVAIPADLLLLDG